MTPTFYSARQRVVILTFASPADAARWDVERPIDGVTIDGVTIVDVTIVDLTSKAES